jgi:hypothetical protein
VEITEVYYGLQVRTLAPDSTQPYESGPPFMDHFTLTIKDENGDAPALRRALRQYTINVREVPE